MDFKTAHRLKCGGGSSAHPPRLAKRFGSRGGRVRWFLLLVIACWSVTAWADFGWKQLNGGIQYKKLIIDQKTLTEQNSTPGLIHLFQIDPLKYRLDIITAKQFKMVNIDAKTMVLKSGALIAINGGFFSPEFQSLGLLVQKGREINRPKWTSWWHIFQVQKSTPAIITKQEYLPSSDTEMAIEAGPRLLVDGNPPENLKPSSAERTAIGITANNQIIIAVTENHQISMAEFSRELKSEGCVNALNLDGGTSTQAYARVRGFKLDRPGFGLVANGIGIFQR